MPTSVFLEREVLPPGMVMPAGSGTGVVGLGGTLASTGTSSQTGANTNETDLWSVTVPGNTLLNANDGLRLTASLFAAATATTKRIRVYFGSTAVFDGGVSTQNGRVLAVEALVWRITGTTQIGMSMGFSQATGSTFGAAINGTGANTLPAETLSGDVVVRVTGQNGTANAGDIVFLGGLLGFFRAA